MASAATGASEGTTPAGVGANTGAGDDRRTTTIQRCCAWFYWIQGWDDEEYGGEFLPYFFTPAYEVKEKIYYEKFFGTFGVFWQCYLCLGCYLEVKKMENLFQHSTNCSEGVSKQAMAHMAGSIEGLKISLEWIFIFAGVNLLNTLNGFWIMWFDKKKKKTKEEFVGRVRDGFFYFFFWCPWCKRAQVSPSPAPENNIWTQEAPPVAVIQAMDADNRDVGVAAHQVQTEMQLPMQQQGGPEGTREAASGGATEMPAVH